LDHTTRPQAHITIHSFKKNTAVSFLDHPTGPQTHSTTPSEYLRGKLKVSHIWTIPHGHKPRSLSTHLEKKYSTIFSRPSHTASSPQHNTLRVLKGKIDGLSYLDLTTRPQAHITIHSFKKNYNSIFSGPSHMATSPQHNTL
jgi:hypothetical protein